MSLILDALKKAEQDRHAGQAPVLDEMLVRRAPLAASRRRNTQQDAMVLAAIALALLFAAAGLVYWLWPTTPQTTAVTADAARPAESTPPPEATAPSAAPLRIDPERLAAPVADVPDDVLDSGDTGATEAMTLDDLDGSAPQGSPEKAAPAPAEQVPEAQYQAAAPQPEPVPTPPPAPAQPVVAEPAVRSLKEMPPAFRSEFPKLVLDVHVYNDNPLRRFALINGKKYRETDTLLDGPRVLEITPQGVIVEHRGSRVLVPLPG